MHFVKYIELSYRNHKYYSYKSASSVEMSILGQFLFSDVGDSSSSFRDWLFHEPSTDASINATSIEKENGFVLIRGLYSEEEEPTVLKVTYDQFLQLLRDWDEKVIKLQPQEVIIKHENNQFVIETTFSA